MSSAEHGGNQPQQVVLIGGPKHAELMGLPKDQNDYEFTSAKSLMPYDAKAASAGWSTWPETATHHYKYDAKLTRIMLTTAYKNVDLKFFVHESLWGTPFYGGFNLHALSEALKALERAKADAETWQKRLLEKQQIVSDRNKELSDFQNKYDLMLEMTRTMDERLRATRAALEAVDLQVTQAIRMTGREYTSRMKGVLNET